MSPVREDSWGRRSRLSRETLALIANPQRTPLFNGSQVCSRSVGGSLERHPDADEIVVSSLKFGGGNDIQQLVHGLAAAKA
jgi:hypothetical protein